VRAGRAETNYGPDGIGTTVGTLFDETGAVGSIQQSVLVRRGPRPYAEIDASAAFYVFNALASISMPR
jgi:hypothetical protein